MQERAAERSGESDEMILSAGDYLERALAPAARRLAWERAALLALSAGALGGNGFFFIFVFLFLWLGGYLAASVLRQTALAQPGKPSRMTGAGALSWALQRECKDQHSSVEEAAVCTLFICRHCGPCCLPLIGTGVLITALQGEPAHMWCCAGLVAWRGRGWVRAGRSGM
jgi:hypothetical protein